MKKAYLKIISLMLVLVTVFCVMPVTALSTNDGMNDLSTSLSSANNSMPEPEIVPNPDYVKADIVEVVSRREENVKHFRLEDGSVTAIVYSYAVHRKDENGAWQDIDNHLYKDAMGYYSTSENKVSFAGNVNDESLFTLRENGYSISIGLVPAKETVRANEVLVTNHLPREEQLLSVSKKMTANEKFEQVATIDNRTSLRYKNFSNGIDLEYILQANEIKEYIVVNSLQDEYIYKFTLQLDGLNARLMDDGSVVLCDKLTEKEEYYIPAPYMFDADGEICTKVYYELEKHNDEQYTLTVVADSNWINDKSRAFPVKIDPTLQQKVLYDTYINSSEPGINYGSSDELWISPSKIAYMSANLSSIPDGSVVDFATLNIAYYYYSYITDGELDVGVYQVEKDWEELDLTWSVASQYNNKGISTTQLSCNALRGDAGAYKASPQWQSFVITDAVNSWFNGSPNYGVALIRESGTNSSVIVCSYEFGIDYRPYFIIRYKEPVITEGVYKLKSVFNGLYLTTGGTPYASGAPIQQKASTGNDSINQLFKITYIQDYGRERYYNIRPMTNSSLGLNAPLATSSSHEVTVTSMATTDGWYDASETQRWTIQTNAGGAFEYVTLFNAFPQNGGYLATPSNSTNGAAVLTTTTLKSNCKWILERYTGDKLDHISMTSFKSSIELGQSFDYEAYMYDDQIGVNGPVSYRVRNVDYSLTDKAIINSVTGQLSTLKCGAIKIGVTYDNAPWVWYWTVEIYDNTAINTIAQTSEIISGQYYYLMNCSSMLHADFLDSSTLSGSPVIQQTLSGTQSQRIQFNYIVSGEYELRPAHTTKILTANADGTVCISADVNSSNQRWYIIRNGKCLILVNKAYQNLKLSNNSKRTVGSSVILSSGTGFLWEIGGSDKNITSVSYSAGVRLKMINNQYYYDYTIPLNNLFNSAVDLCEEHRCISMTEYFSQMYQPSVAGWRGMQLRSFLWFYNQVNHDAVWDIKRPVRWSNAMPNVPYLGLDVEFAFRDILVTAEDIGNIMYGYTGRATGFGSITLYWGGGVAATGDVGSPEVTSPPFYGDDANDHYNIEYGYNLFSKDYPNYHAVGYDGIPLDGWIAEVANIILNPGT